MPRRSRDVLDERDYLDVRVREREDDRDRDHLNRYFQEDRRADTGALVLRQRETETVERSRPRRRSPSPSPVRYREVIRERSTSPLPPPRDRDVTERIEVRDTVYDRERGHPYRAPSRGPQDRVVMRVVDRERARSPTPSPDGDGERERIRIIEHSRSRAPSISPSPSPPPVERRQIVHGPVVEREVITHYTDVDHGTSCKPTLSDYAHLQLPSWSFVVIDSVSRLILIRYATRRRLRITSAAPAQARASGRPRDGHRYLLVP